jgi:hypothetical protein
MVLLRSIKTKIEALGIVHKPTLRGLTLTIGTGIATSLALAFLLTYMDTGSWYQTADAVRKFEW